MDAPLWKATSYGMLEVHPMNSCLAVRDVPSLEVLRDRLDGAWINLGWWEMAHGEGLEDL